MIKRMMLGTALSALLALPAFAESHMVNGEKLATEQVFTYRLLDDIQTIDPQLVTDVAGFEVTRDVFEGLMNSAPDGSMEPGVATGFTVSDDKLVYTYTLRESNWSDGTPVTAHDFVYSWRRLVDPATASEYAWYMELMRVKNASKVVSGEVAPDQLGIRAVDDYTLEITIDTAVPYFPIMVAHASTFPAPKATIEAHGDAWTNAENFVGNGAYILSEYKVGEQIVRVRNPEYWDNANTRIEKTVGLIINDENQALTRYLAGEVAKTNAPSGQFPRLANEYPAQAISSPYSCSYIYWFNQTESGPEALKDVRVRKALSYAVNREIITDRVLQGGQYQSYNFAHQASAGFTLPEIDYAGWTQDERDERAVALLAEAGYGPDNPLELSLSYNSSETHKKIAIAVTQFWKQTLGVKIELVNAEWKVHVDNLQNGNFDIGRYAWCGDYDEASTYLDLLTSYSNHNVSGYASDEYDALMRDSKGMADPNPNYSAAEALLADAMPFAPIYQYTAAMMLQENVRGWPVENLMQSWYSRDLYIVDK